jgi:hypothetical protein
MTLKEAYELLDLPEGSDIQQVRACFSEQHGEYRMLIDNAPTPNLRQRYEQNLALREEAFQLINGGSNLDDAADLPNTGQSSYVEPAKATSKTLTLPEALALLGLTESDSTDIIERTYNSHRGDLEAELQRAKIESIKLAYTKELENLAKAWVVIEPWLKEKLLKEPFIHKQKEEKQRIVLPSAADTKKPTDIPASPKKSLDKRTKVAIGIGLLAILIIFVWSSANNNNPEVSEQPVSTDISAIVSSESEPDIIPDKNEEMKPTSDEKPAIKKTKYKCYNIENEGLCSSVYNDKVGFINSAGEVVIAFIYDGDNSSYFVEGFADVRMGDKYGYIDKKGNAITAFKYNSASSFYEGRAKVESDGKNGYIDNTGKEIIPLKYSFAYPFINGLAHVELNGKAGFIDKTGKEVIPLKYDDFVSFSEGFVAAKLNRKWGYLDVNGKEVIPFKYDYANYFIEGRASVKSDHKYGFIDKTGAEITPIKYETASTFYNGRASVELNGKFGFIDESGKEVIPLIYEEANAFYEKGRALVVLNGKSFFINKAGNCVKDCN